MTKDLHPYSTDDIDLASSIHAWGGKLIDVDKEDLTNQVFIFELTAEQLARIPTYYDGSGQGSYLAICNSRGVLFRLLRNKQAIPTLYNL